MLKSVVDDERIGHPHVSKLGNALPIRFLISSISFFVIGILALGTQKMHSCRE